MTSIMQNKTLAFDPLNMVRSWQSDSISRRKDMVGKGKANKAFKELSPGLKKDGINQLPNDLICRILSHLSTKETVKTSVLSTRWRHLWLWVPSFELKSQEFSDFNTFVSFGDRFFDSNRVSFINKLNLTIDTNDNGVDDAFYLTSWFDAVAKRKIRHLHVGSYCYGDRKFHKMPRRIYKCETLVCLKLFQVTLDDPEFVSLPCLKTMHLEYVEYPNEATFETLILCCPVLEDLKIVVASDDGQVFRVHSPSLKRLTLERVSSSLLYTEGVVIDAPQLCFLSINDNVSRSFKVNNLESNAKLDISRVFCSDEFDDEEFDEEIVSWRRSSIRSFLADISKVRDMTIHQEILKLVSRYSIVEPLPQFDCMRHMHINVYISDMKWIPTFLDRCSNLKSLILICEKSIIKIGYYLEEIEQNSCVPKCLLSSLEFVDFKGHVFDLKLVKYFLKNSAILKKLTLSLGSYSRKDDIFKKLLKTPRGSSKCKVFIL